MSKAELGAASACVSPTSHLQVQRGAFFCLFLSHLTFLILKTV